MGWLARVLASGAAVLVGCTSIAGINDDAPIAPQELTAEGGNAGPSNGSSGTSNGSSGSGGSTSSSGSSGSSGSSSSSGSSGSSGGNDGGGVADAAPDVYVAPCTKKPDGDPCMASSECCGKCTEEKECKDKCKNGGDTCNPLASNECCVGSYCGGLCRPCRTAGQTPDNAPLSTSPSAKSCCSKSINGTTGKCD